MATAKLTCHTTLSIEGMGVEYLAGKAYEFKLNVEENSYEDVRNGNLFTVNPDGSGKSYKSWFNSFASDTKKFSQMDATELKAARADLRCRLQSTLRPSKVIKLTDEGVTLQGGALEGVYDAKNERLKVRSTNSSIGEISVAQLNHAQNVLKRFFNRANGIDLGGVDL